MPKNRPGGRKRRAEPHRSRPVRRSPSDPHRNQPADLSLMRGIRDVLAEAHPMHLLGFTSALLALSDPRDHASGSAGPPLEALVQSFVEVDRVETTALLTVIAALSPDDLLRARLRRELAERRHPLPTWLERLDEARPDSASEMVHLQRDGDNVMVGVRLAPSHALTAVIYIDHNLGTLVKDAFILPASLADTEHEFRRISAESGHDAGMRIASIDGADARARITEAIDLAAVTYPPLETDSWPACRPLVEWIMRLLPAGGAGYERPEWSDAERRDLVRRFFASPYAHKLLPRDRADHIDLMELVVDFGVGYGTGDPMHWSPVSVEIILTDWLPRKVIAPVPFLEKLPALLRAFIRFCHAEQALPANLTALALEAVDDWLPAYREEIRTGNAGPLALFSLEAGPGAPAQTFDLAAHFEARIAVMQRQVGGASVLARLDTDPLPDEPFDWTKVGGEDHERIEEILRMIDLACDAVLDREHRTACRRFLVEVDRGDAGMLTRTTNPAYAAAAICWVIGQANDTFSTPDHPARVKDLMAALKLTGSVAQRGYGMVRASGRPRPQHADEIELGSTALLVSAQRRRIIERRDWFGKLLAEERAGG